jgi:glutathionylspermidine synthase
VGDVCTIAKYALLLDEQTADALNTAAEALAAETMAMEQALLQRPELYRALGLSRPLRRALRAACSADPGLRLLRFDFHPCVDGWRLSEVNSDVPGGWAEASLLPELVGDALSMPLRRSERFRFQLGDALCAALCERVPEGGLIGMVHATSYADDRQVMQFLADRLIAAGRRAQMMAPDHLDWRAAGGARGVQAMVRFFPAEWLPRLPRRSDWTRFFTHPVPACNHATALLTQSKRLPLLWSRLGVSCPSWQRWLPETVEARWSVLAAEASEWVLKPAWGRVGESITLPGSMKAKNVALAWLSASFAPEQWLMQRRFHSLPLQMGMGWGHVCVGVFTLGGRALGYYGRLSTRQRIDEGAQDLAVLVGVEERR